MWGKRNGQILKKLILHTPILVWEETGRESHVTSLLTQEKIHWRVDEGGDCFEQLLPII